MNLLVGWSRVTFLGFLVLSLGLIYRFGFAGAVVGTSISLLASSFYFIYVFHRHTGYSFGKLFKESYAKPIVISVILLSGIMALWPTRSLSWFGLATLAASFGGLYSVLILLSRFFDEYDCRKLEQFLPLARHVRKLCRVA